MNNYVVYVSSKSLNGVVGLINAEPADAVSSVSYFRSGVLISTRPHYFPKDWSLKHLYGHCDPTADSTRIVISHRRTNVDLVLINR